MALNLTGNGPSANVARFTVTPSSAPAALPAAEATETSLEFGFEGPERPAQRDHGPGCERRLPGAHGCPDRPRNRAGAQKLIALLKAGKDREAQKLATGFVDLMDSASPGAMQQEILSAEPGYYVQACFMDTQDGREHTQLGMERLIRIVK